MQRWPARVWLKLTGTRIAPASGELSGSAALPGFAIVLPLLLAVLFAAEPILALFGDEFVGGAMALRILAIGQLVNVAAGPAGAGLTMMGREKTVLLIEILTVILSVAALFAFVPAYGLVAVASVSAGAMILRNSLSLIALRRATQSLS